MFTSRAEHRLVLREDNTIDRLANASLGIGLLSEARVEELLNVKSRRAKLLARLKETRITPTPAIQARMTELKSSALLKSTTLEELLRRPEISTQDAISFLGDVNEDPNVLDAVEIEVKYSGYIQSQNELIQQAKNLEDFKVPTDLVYYDVKGLSAEECEQLTRRVFFSMTPLQIGHLMKA